MFNIFLVQKVTAYHWAWYAKKSMEGYKNQPVSSTFPSPSIPNTKVSEGVVWKRTYELYELFNSIPTSCGIMEAGILSCVLHSVPLQFMSARDWDGAAYTKTPRAPFFSQFWTYRDRVISDEWQNIWQMKSLAKSQAQDNPIVICWTVKEKLLTFVKYEHLAPSIETRAR